MREARSLSDWNNGFTMSLDQHHSMARESGVPNQDAPLPESRSASSKRYIEYLEKMPEWDGEPIGPRQEMLDIWSKIQLHGDADVVFRNNMELVALRDCQPEVVSEHEAETSSYRNTLGTPLEEYGNITDSEFLTLIQKRCDLKIKAVDWALARDQTDPETSRSTRSAIIREAKNLQKCYLWMLRDSLPDGDNNPDWWAVSECYDALARIAHKLAYNVNRDKESKHFRDGLRLAAEAQSMLRVAIARVHDQTDTEQRVMLAWLIHVSSRHRVLIGRYMRENEPADPANRKDLLARIKAYD